MKKLKVIKVVAIISASLLSAASFAKTMAVSGSSVPFMFENQKYVGSPIGVPVQADVVSKSARVRFSNGTYQSLPVTATTTKVTTNYTFKTSALHRIILDASYYYYNPKNDFEYQESFHGEKSVDPCNKGIECI